MTLEEIYNISQYKNEKGCLLNMDCVEGTKMLPDSSIDLTVTSPPYDNLRKYKNGSSFDFENLAKQLFRITKEGGVVVWIVNDATKNGNESLTSFRQAIYFQKIGFNVLDTMIYEKSGCGACGSNNCYIQNFEYMFVFTKGKIKTHNLIYDRENISVGKQKTNTNRNKYNADNKRRYREIETKKMGRRFNIWRYNQTSGQDEFSKKHPAPFPQDLVKDHIISWSNENDIVYDPFMGSGTTAKMSQLLNRRWIGVELSNEYCKLIEERIENI